MIDWREGCVWETGRYRVTQRNNAYVVEYVVALWHQTQQLRQIGVCRSLKQAQALCTRHARRVEKGAA